MIRLTKQTDYGIVLMSQVAVAGDRLLTASDLAHATRLPLPMVSKILKALARAGLLSSQRGAKGGYVLARAAADISVAAIIAALEGPIAITECVEESDDYCTYEATCRVRGNWQKINHVVHEALDGISLEQMAEPWRARRRLPTALDPERLVSIGT